MSGVCSKFKKIGGGRGRAARDAPCANCGVLWKDHTQVSVKASPEVTSKIEAIESTAKLEWESTFGKGTWDVAKGAITKNLAEEEKLKKAETRKATKAKKVSDSADEADVVEEKPYKPFTEEQARWSWDAVFGEGSWDSTEDW